MLVANPGYQKPPATEPATEAAKLDPAVKATKMWLEPVRSGSVGNPLAMQTQQTRSFCRLIMGTKGPHNTLIKHRSFCTGR